MVRLTLAYVHSKIFLFIDMRINYGYSPEFSKQLWQSSLNEEEEGKQNEDPFSEAPLVVFIGKIRVTGQPK